MPERELPAETLRAGRPFTVGSATLLLVERVAIRSYSRPASVWFSAVKEPYALVVRDTEGVHAVEISGPRISLDDLRSRIPALDALLASI